MVLIFYLLRMEMNAELKREKSRQKRKAQEKRRKIEKETGEVSVV